MMENLIDWFGKDFRILSRNEKELIVRLKCSEDAFFYWAMQYAGLVEVLDDEVRELIREELERMSEKYG